MSEYKPKIEEKCLMAIGNERHPPASNDYEIGILLEYGEKLILWKDERGCKNTYHIENCCFKPVTKADL
jgi:hypothetical protein